MNDYTAPPGTKCCYCNRDASGSWIRKAMYEQTLPPGTYGYEYGRIKLVGFGWQCGKKREKTVNRFCCGIEINKLWQHCPICGEKLSRGKEDI